MKTWRSFSRPSRHEKVCCFPPIPQRTRDGWGTCGVPSWMNSQEPDGRAPRQRWGTEDSVAKSDTYFGYPQSVMQFEVLRNGGLWGVVACWGVGHCNVK